MSSLPFGGDIVDWLRTVRNGEYISNEFSVYLDVLGGSHCWRLLFLFVNDISDIIINAYILLFADNFKLY